MTAGELAEALVDLLRSLTEDDEGDATELLGATLTHTSIRRADSLASDAGFVVKLTDGAEFEVTITQSRAGDIEEAEGEDDSAP